MNHSFIRGLTILGQQRDTEMDRNKNKLLTSGGYHLVIKFNPQIKK